ncbi:hypothetical protein GCM10022254_12170 [Actinomadura meridiana]|uniref:Uncharacterized protein n=1 Tax=Actinomadura meridiana TaxID=559626 RepID=A0ABP8BUG3_9ACTN
MVLVMVVEGMLSLDEYVPFLVRSTGVAVVAVPLLVLVVTVGDAAGGWMAGRGLRWLVPVLAVGAGGRTAQATEVRRGCGGLGRWWRCRR